MEITLDSGDKIYYVPVLESIERLLNDEFVLAEVNLYKQSRTCYIKSCNCPDPSQS